MVLRTIILLGMVLFTSAFGFPAIHDSTSQPATIDPLQNNIDGIITNTDDWGKGWSVGAIFYYPAPEIELGYTLEGKRNISLGACIGYGQRLFDHESGPRSLYLKLLFGTPVFSNIVSIQGFINPSYYLDKDFGGGINSPFGTGIGGQLSFWVAPQGCITLGTKAQISNRTAKTWDKTALIGRWTMYRIGTLGITFFIN